RDDGRRVPGPGTARRADLARHLGRDAVALRVRLGCVADGRRAVPPVGASHRAGRALHARGGDRTGAAAGVRASGQYRTVEAGDRESIQNEKGRGWVTHQLRIADFGWRIW